jgi:hypothetical protein
MKKLAVIVAGLTLTAVAVVLTYQAAARDRDYRALLARGDAAIRDEQTFNAIEAYSGAIALRPHSMLPHLRTAAPPHRSTSIDPGRRVAT